MGRLALAHRAAAIAIVGALTSAQLAAQGPITSSGRPLAVGEQIPGLPARFWVRLLGDDRRLPDHERLALVTSDGRVLSVVDGGSDAVDLPAALDRWLDDRTMRLVLAHNHPADTSLSGADLALLGRAGVERVVALGHDGSVFEATAGPRFVDRAAMARHYLALEARLKSRLTTEAALAGTAPAPAFRLFSHVIAATLARAGIIDYRVRYSVTLAEQVGSNAGWIERLVASESARLTASEDR